MFKGEDIKKKRKSLGLTAEKLAAILQVSKESIYKWEKGTRPNNASEKAAQVFIQNLNDLGLLDKDNHLLLSETTETDEEITDDKRAINGTLTIPGNITPQKYYGGEVIPKSKPNDNSVSIVQYQDELPLVITLKDGKKARLLYPEGITNDDWDKIIRIIHAMKE